MNRFRAARHAVPAALALATVLVLGGCLPITDDTPPAPASTGDGVRCGTDPQATVVHVDIRYDQDRLPYAVPDRCEVPRGATVTWRGPEGEAVRFEILFKADSPVAGDVRGALVSDWQGDRYRVTRTMGGAPGEYAYGIRANGKERDPAIIIR